MCGLPSKLESWWFRVICCLVFSGLVCERLHCFRMVPVTWQVGVPPGPGRLVQPRGQHVSLAFPSGSLCGDGTGVCYLLPVLDTVFVRRSHRRQGLGLAMLRDFCQTFREDEALGISWPISPAMYQGNHCIGRSAWVTGMGNSYVFQMILGWEVPQSRWHHDTPVSCLFPLRNLLLLQH